MSEQLSIIPREEKTLTLRDKEYLSSKAKASVQKPLSEMVKEDILLDYDDEELDEAYLEYLERIH